jgi:hypothetical protein
MAACHCLLIDTPTRVLSRLHIFEHERYEGKESPMNIQQAEGWTLWEKSIIMRRQALRRAVASVPRRARLASILVMLLTGTWLLGTPAFGGSIGETSQKAWEKALRGFECLTHPACRENR